MQEYMEKTLTSIGDFNKTILTTATAPEYVNRLELHNLPIYEYFKKGKKPIEVDIYENKYTINKSEQNISWDNTSLLEKIDELVSNKEHVLLFTNDKNLHSNFDEISDNITGSSLQNKIQPYVKIQDFKKIDYNNNLHIISSSGFEGFDFDENAHIIIVAKYGFNKDAFSFTYNDIIQMIGRVRKSTLSISLFTNINKDYDYILNNDIKKILEPYRIYEDIQKNKTNQSYSRNTILSDNKQKDAQIGISKVIIPERRSKLNSINFIEKRLFVNDIGKQIKPISKKNIPL